MSENIDKKLQQIIDLEIRELYDLAFFKPYLVNYIADFKPQFHQSMSDREYRDYLERKNEEAIQEFCARFAVYDIPHLGLFPGRGDNECPACSSCRSFMKKWARISLFLQLLPISLWGQNPYALYTAGNKEILDIIAQLPARAPQILDIPCISPVQQPNFDRLRISSGYGLRIHPIAQ